jgi:hypothetical protein
VESEVPVWVSSKATCPLVKHRRTIADVNVFLWPMDHR